MKKFIVVGGGAAGMSASSRIRKLLPDSTIDVYEESGYVSYGPCGIPYYIEGLVSDHNKLITYTPDFFKRERNINVHINSHVLKIDRGATSINILEDGDEQVERYDGLMLCTGASPFFPKSKWAEVDKVYVVRHIEDAIKIKKELNQLSTVGIVGAGYIGVEMAEGLKAVGKDVTLIEGTDQVMPVLDKDISEPVEKAIIEKGIKLYKNVMAQEISGDGKKVHVEGEVKSFDFDAIILSLGVRPNVELAKGAGLKIGTTGALAVDEHLCTNDGHIFAAGDSVEIKSMITGGELYVPLAPEANKEGYVAGTNISGGELVFPGTVGSSITKFFDLEIGAVGLSEKASIRYGIDAQSIVITNADKARYYPGHSKLTLKITFRRGSKTLIGAQAIGSNVWGRISALSVAIQAKMTPDDLFFSGIPYAPPFSPVWDSMIIAARLGKESPQS